nr:cysteine-rich KTR domain-containing protein [Sedimentibacter sp.]
MPLESEWILCPVCKSKTRLRMRKDTVLETFPLFCPKCKQKTIIAIRELNTSVVKDPDAKTQSQ